MDAQPIVLIVEVHVKPGRVADFEAAIAIDAIGSRKEPGCLRFEVFVVNRDDGRFVLHEIYTSSAALAEHKQAPHYAAWTEFKASDGTFADEQRVLKATELVCAESSKDSAITPMDASTDAFFRPVAAADLERIIALEVAGYPPDEVTPAASALLCASWPAAAARARMFLAAH